MKQIDSGISFPALPSRWGQEERNFAFGLRSLFEQNRWQRAYPVGIVVLSSRDQKPFTFGEWESITTGITDVYGWRRIK